MWHSSLWPLYRSRREGSRVDTRFPPVSFSVRDDTPQARKPRALTIFPFVFHEKTQKHGSDWAIFPLFGILHNRFGRDGIRFVLWPVYTRIRKGERTTHNVLWPFLAYSTMPDGSGWKVWPLYGRRHAGDRLEKQFVLWPLYTCVDVDLPTVGRYQARMYWPFYGWEKSSHADSWTWLWPFVRRVENHKASSRTWHAFWPLVGWSRGKNERWTKCLPFYRKKVHHRRGTSQLVAPYPLFWLDKMDRKEYRKTSWRLVPLLWHIREHWLETGRCASFTQLWPIFRWQRHRGSADGPVVAERLMALSLWPFSDISNVDRPCGPFLLQVFEHRLDDDGTRTTHLLWRLFRRKRGKDYHFLEVWPLVAFGRSSTSSRFALLKGLFEFQDNPMGRYLRLFFSPRFRIRDPETEPAGHEL